MPISKLNTVPEAAPTANGRRRLRPLSREPWAGLVVPPVAQILGDQHHRREGDAEAGQDDVEPEGEPHLVRAASRLEEGPPAA